MTWLSYHKWVLFSRNWLLNCGQAVNILQHALPPLLIGLGKVDVQSQRHSRFRPSQQAILRELEAQDRPLVVLLLGAPYDATLIHNAKCVICAYEYTYLAANMLLEALETGQFRGHLPVQLQALA